MTAKRFTETLSTGIITDHITGKEYKCEMRIDDELLKLLNELHEENKELQDTIKTICKDFEESHGMDIRNADWFTAW